MLGRSEARRRSGATGASRRYAQNHARGYYWCRGRPDQHITVDRTHAEAAYDDIESAGGDGEFYAQMKAPKRERDLSTGQLRYRWTETGALEHYRHAQAFDSLAGIHSAVPRVYLL